MIDIDRSKIFSLKVSNRNRLIKKSNTSAIRKILITEYLRIYYYYCVAKITYYNYSI